jgi:hypothetical protein
MKIIDLRKKLITRAIIAIILFAVNLAIFLFYKNIKENSNNEIRKIETNISSISSRIIEVESKRAKIEKYKILWENLEDKHKDLNGIKAEEFNKKLEEISKKYLIKTSDVKINLPEVIKDGIFKRETFDIYLTSVSIKYNSVNDILAISFINEFIQSLNGYPIITYFDIKKDKSYEAKDLIDISYGKATGAISGRLEFFWYVPKSL